MNYYNENNPDAAAWLRVLIARGHLPPGFVDDRDLREVQADDLREFTQCHFFAGIGGWPYALKLADWDNGRPVWTGSCPCQPFSRIGRHAGFADERHLWPTWRTLIAQCRPPIVFGEQVAGKVIGPWIDAVFDDMEAMGYATAAAAFPAASIGAAHVRQRTYWMGYAHVPGLERHAGHDGHAQRETAPGSTATASVSVPWESADWIECSDGFRRPVEPGTFPLAYGIPARMVRLRGYGNAIVPQQAETFIRASLEAMEEMAHA